MGNYLTITTQTNILSLGIVAAAFIHTFIGSMIMQVSIGIITSRVGLDGKNMSLIIRNFPKASLIITPQAFGIIGEFYEI